MMISTICMVQGARPAGDRPTDLTAMSAAIWRTGKARLRYSTDLKGSLLMPSIGHRNATSTMDHSTLSPHSELLITASRKEHTSSDQMSLPDHLKYIPRESLLQTGPASMRPCTSKKASRGSYSRIHSKILAASMVITAS